MIEIVFESHATTFDNEKKIASGHFDVGLSETGIEQAKQLGQRRKDEKFDTIFTSDMQRAYNTAVLAFGDKFPIIKDKRLRECDYGDFEHKPSSVIERERIKRIEKPFPDGESYTDCTERMNSFLDDLQEKYEGKRVMVIGHRATHYGLKQRVTGELLEDIVTAPWQWQPGWVYQLDETKK